LDFGVMQGIGLKLNEIEVPENQTMLLYTDGVSEAQNETEEQFGDDRIDKMLLESEDNSDDKICEKFLIGYLRHKNHRIRRFWSHCLVFSIITFFGNLSIIV